LEAAGDVVVKIFLRVLDGFAYIGEGCEVENAGGLVAAEDAG